MKKLIRCVDELAVDIRQCQACDDLPLGAKPIIQLGGKAKILLVGQAPGRITHEKGIPFDDPSGERLRAWLGVDRMTFYSPDCFTILPMGFCYPGKGRSGDLPPKKRCANLWREALHDALGEIDLTLLIGQYAIEYYLNERRSNTVTETVCRWREFFPAVMPLPHPSPRNNLWLRKNPWFEEDCLPVLKTQVKRLLSE